MSQSRLGDEEKELLKTFGKTLREQGFTSGDLISRIPHRGDPKGIDVPYLLSRKLDTSIPLDMLFALFSLQGSVPREHIEACLTPEIVAGLVNLELLVPDESGGTLFPLVEINPLDGGLFITDPGRVDMEHQPEWVRKRFPVLDRVMFLGSDSVLLSRSFLREKYGRVLDLCCGCGIQAIMASPHSDRVKAVDLNPRALRFAEMNAELNGCSNIEFLEGNLYGPLADQQFDLILANPPFIAAPEISLLYRDGGPTGEDVLRPIIDGLPQYLDEKGICQIVTDMVFQEHHPYESKVRHWLAPHGDRYDVLLSIKNRWTPFDYALAQKQTDPYIETSAEKAESFCSLMDLYDRERMTSIVFGLISIRQVPFERQGWYREYEIQQGGDDGVGGSIQETFGRLKRFDTRDFYESMLGKRPQLVHGTLVNQIYKPQTEEGPRDLGMQVIPPPADWLVGDLQINEEGLRLLESCDGTRTVEQLVGHLLGEASLGRAAQRLAICQQINRFYELGVLDIE